MWATVALEGGLKQKVCAPPHPDSKWLLTFSFLCFLEAIRQSWCVSALLFQSRFNSAWFAEGMNLLRWPQTSLLMKRNMLLWETLLLCDCFCFSGSNVSWNQLGMRVYLAMLRSCVFRATAGKTSPLVFRLPGWKLLKGKCYLWLCEEQLSFHELVTLRDLLCGSLVRWGSKCFLLLGFSTLGALGPMKY